MLPETPINTQEDLTLYVARVIEKTARKEAGQRQAHRKDSLYLTSLRAVKWGLQPTEEAQPDSQGASQPKAPFRIETPEGPQPLQPLGPAQAGYQLMASYTDSQPGLPFGPWDAIGSLIAHHNGQALRWGLGQASQARPSQPLPDYMRPEAGPEASQEDRQEAQPEASHYIPLGEA